MLHSNYEFLEFAVSGCGWSGHYLHGLPDWPRAAVHGQTLGPARPPARDQQPGSEICKKTELYKNTTCKLVHKALSIIS